MRRISMALAGLLTIIGLTGCSKAADTAAGSPTTTPAPGLSAPSQPAATTPAPATTPPATQTTQSQAQWPTPEDCVSYNPATITVSYADGSYTVESSDTIVMRFVSQQDDTVQAQAKALAQRWTKHCYLGRGNTRTDQRGSYIFDYWRGASGMTPTIPGEDDICSDYNRNNLTVEDMGDGDGWRVKDHDHVLHLFDNGSDARNGKLVLQKYGHICEFGDSNGGDNDTIDYLR